MIVSVVIPCRNEVAHIESCITTIYKSKIDSISEIEVIVVDGLSDDGTIDKLNQIAKSYSSLKIVSNRKQVTPVAFNLGIKAAKGEYVQIIGARQLISEDYKSGKFQTFYVDKIRGATIGESATQTYDSMMQSGQMMVDWSTTSRTSTYFARVGPKDKRPYMRGFDIQDRVDVSKPITFCAKYFEDQDAQCREIDPAANVFTNPDTNWFGFNSGGYMAWTYGMHCAVSVNYTDLNGFEVISPVLVNHEQREEYAPNDIDKVIECAGEYYRPRN